MTVRPFKDMPRELLSAEECREAIAEAFPVIELHHYVLPGAWPAGLWLIGEAHGLHAGFVLAETEARYLGLVFFTHSLSIRINDVVVGAVEDAAALTCPIESLYVVVASRSRLRPVRSHNQGPT